MKSPRACHIFAASPFTDLPEDKINVEISINSEAPHSDSLEEAVSSQWGEAKKLHEILLFSLPQGVMSKLFAIMAEHQAAHIKYSLKKMIDLSKGEK